MQVALRASWRASWNQKNLGVLNLSGDRIRISRLGLTPTVLMDICQVGEQSHPAI